MDEHKDASGSGKKTKAKNLDNIVILVYSIFKMVEQIEGVNVHCSSDLTMVTLNKQCGHVWLFTITCKVRLCQFEY